MDGMYPYGYEHVKENPGEIAVARMQAAGPESGATIAAAPDSTSLHPGYAAADV